MTAELLPGAHKLAYNDESVKFVVKPNDQGVVLNPTLSSYIFHHEIYEVEGKDTNAELEQIWPAYMHDFTLESGEVIKVPFKVINSLFIEQYEYYWHLGINDPYKERIYVDEKASNLNTAPQSKLFRLQEFHDYIGDGMPESIMPSIKPNTQKLSELEAYQLVPDSVICDCQPANEGINKIRLQFDSLKIVEPAEFMAIQNRLRYGNQLRNYEKECSPRYNQSLDDNNFDKIMVTIGKEMEVLGRKNAYIVD